jgi:hypothetical protein
MKIIINESRLEKLALNYIKKQLGEYVPSNDNNWVGLFYKDGEGVAGIFDNNLYVSNELYNMINKMFDLGWIQNHKLFRIASTDLSGIETDRVINIEKIYLE